MPNILTEQVTHKQTKSYSFINKAKECQNFINTVKRGKPLFMFVAGGTETALLPGISATNQNTELLKHAPAIVVNYLTHGQDLPDEIQSQAVSSKKMIELMKLDICIVDTGTFVKPDTVHIDLNMGPARCLTTGLALDPVKTSFLFQKGEKLGLNLSNYPYVIISEYIPGGTVTALGVLCSLGINAFDLVTDNSTEGKQMWINQTVKDALLNNANNFHSIKKNPLKAIECFGDPTQAFICGFIKGAQKVNLPVMLSDGFQMLAVYYVSKLLTGFNPYDVIVTTTPDQSTKTKKLAELISAPLISLNINFEESLHKESIGSGGLVVATELMRADL